MLDRSIRISLQRKRRSDDVARFRYRDAHAATEALRSALAEWAEATIPDLYDARPDWPQRLNDRACESWEPLFAIADLGGLDERARTAALALMVDEDDDSQAHGLRLLAALRGVFADEHAMSTRDILEAINDDEELPFGWSEGRGFSGRDLARLLRPFGLRPRVVRIGHATPRGYLRDEFIDAWERYVDAPPSEQDLSATSATSPAQSQKSPISHPQHGRDVADGGSGEIPLYERDVADVAHETAQNGPSAVGAGLVEACEACRSTTGVTRTRERMLCRDCAERWGT